MKIVVELDVGDKTEEEARQIAFEFAHARHPSDGAFLLAKHGVKSLKYLGQREDE